MACQHVKFDNGIEAIVCGGRRHRRKCACGQPATKLCDYPKKLRKTCDAPLCDKCAVNVGPDRDYCPRHSLSPRPAVQGALAL